MASVYPLKSDFRRGEITPYAHAAVDTETYQGGLHTCRNWLVMRYGGLTRRPGLSYTNEAKDGALTGSVGSNAGLRFIPFIFSETQAYNLEFGHLYIRFHTPSGRVESGGSPVEVVSPYDVDDLYKISYRESGDVVYLACRGYHPRVLTRLSETSWTLALHDPKDGPYLPQETSGTTLKPADYGGVVPKMTSLTAPSGTVTSQASAADAWELFDKNKNTNSIFGSSATGGWVAYDFPSTNTKTADAYWITAGLNSNRDTTSAPREWTFDGYDGTNWIVLDTRENVTWDGSLTQFFEFKNETAYQSYRLSVLRNGGGGNTEINELGIHQRAEEQTAFNLTASAVTGINGDTGFQTTDVGRLIRLLGTDNRWRWAKIIARTSTTVVTIQLYGHALPDLNAISNWQLSAWSDFDDYPSCVGFYQDRLTWSGPATRPRSMALSRNADYDHHGVSDPVVADDGVDVTLSGGRLNEALWMIETDDMVIGTAGGIRIIGPNDPGEAFSPTNVQQRGQTAIRASNVIPALVDRTVIFAEKHRKALYETAFTIEANGYVALELTWLAEHLFRGKIREMAFQQEPSNVLWVMLEDGAMVACTYDRQAKVFGVGRVTTGAAGSKFEALTVIPSDDGDIVFAGVRRVIGSNTGFYVETVNLPWREGDDGVPIYFDSAVRYTGSSTATMSGLDHLEGATVGVYADGADIGDATVSSGAITLPGGVSAADIVAGLRVDTYARTLRAPSVGQKDGGHLGRKTRVVSGYVDVLETYGLKGGTLAETRTMTTESDHVNAPNPPALHTGVLHLHTDDSNDNNGVYVLETDRAYPANVRALMTELEGEP